MTRAFLPAFLGCSSLLAQASSALISEAKFPWTVMRDNLLKMAERMPEENYSFKPTRQIETGADRVAKAGIRRGGPCPPEPTRTKLATLNNMVRYSNEMYGYMCVYLRLKGIVPPSSAPE
jgi:hypothetical protein